MHVNIFWMYVDVNRLYRSDIHKYIITTYLTFGEL